MQKYILLLLILTSIISGCTPQVTATPEATATLPTATQTPEPSTTPTAVYTPTSAKEIITNTSGIGFALGEQIEGQPEGVRAVIDIVPSDAMNAEKQAEFKIRTNPETFGFKPGETQLVHIPTEDGKFRIELQRTSNADVIAVFENTGFTWNPEKLVSDDGNPIALRSGNVIEMNGGEPIYAATDRSALFRLTNEMNLLFPQLDSPTRYHEVFISKDGKGGVPFGFSPTNEEKTEGYFYFRAADNRSIIYMFVKGYDRTLSFAETWRWR